MSEPLPVSEPSPKPNKSKCIAPHTMHWWGPDEEGNPRCMNCLMPGCKELGGEHEWETVRVESGGCEDWLDRCEACGEWKED